MTANSFTACISAIRFILLIPLLFMFAFLFSFYLGRTVLSERFSYLLFFEKTIRPEIRAGMLGAISFLDSTLDVETYILKFWFSNSQVLFFESLLRSYCSQYCGTTFSWVKL